MTYQVVANAKVAQKLGDLVKKFNWGELISLKEDPSHGRSAATLMAIEPNGEARCIGEGVPLVEHFLTTGYVKVPGKCPHHLFGACRGHRCQKFYVSGYLGDCSTKWAAITNIEILKSLRRD